LVASLFPLAGKAIAKQPTKAPPAATAQQQEAQPSSSWVIAKDDSWACRSDIQVAAIRTMLNGEPAITRYEFFEANRARVTTWFENSNKRKFFIEMVATRAPDSGKLTYTFSAPQGYSVNSTETDTTGNVARFEKIMNNCFAVFTAAQDIQDKKITEKDKDLIGNLKSLINSTPPLVVVPQGLSPATMADIE
jgi:hypothetical protein